MAYRVVILKGALAEYVQILRYLDENLGNKQAARDFAEEFERQTALVAENPHLHALSRLPELAAKGYRSYFVKRYVVLYKIKDDLVVVAHIFHQTQNYARLVRPEE